MKKKFGCVWLCTMLSLMVFAWALCGCHGKRPSLPVVSQEDAALAQALCRRILQVNSDVRTVRGVGSLQLCRQDGCQGGRLAWIGKTPAKVRLVLMGVAGRPVATYAHDGRWQYLLMHQDRRLVRKPATDPLIRQLVSVDLMPQMLLGFILGRLPVCPDGQRRLFHSSPAQGEILSVACPDYTDRIFMASGDRLYNGMERLDRSGRRVFRIFFEGWQKVDGAWIPRRVRINGDNKDALVLGIDDCRLNMPIDADRFVLRPQ